MKATARIRTGGGLHAGARLVLPAAESRHVRVLRLESGDRVVVFDGASDVEWPAEIVATAARGGVELRLGAPVAVDRELAVAVTLAVAMPANDRMDFLVEKATELGAFALQPLIATRSVLRLSGTRAEARRSHWQGVASAASEQCGRTRVAAVALPMPLGDWLEACTDALASRVVLSLAGDARPLAAIARSAFEAGAGQAITVLSGPEGGLTEDEERAAAGAEFVRATLGPRVLRADTAPLAALATIAAAWTLRE